MDTEHIKTQNILKKFTDDFSSEDISFIECLDFPIFITVTNLDLKEDSPNRISTRMVENIEELENEFKKFPENCEIVIPDISGNMRLISRK